MDTVKEDKSSFHLELDSVVKFFIGTAVLGVAISYSKLYLFHIALIFTILLFLQIRKFKIEKIRVHLHWLFYFWLFWYVLSILWSDAKIYSFQYIFYLFCGISIVIIIIYYAASIEKLEGIFKVLMIMFIVEIFIALMEAFNVIRLPVSPYSRVVEYFGRQSALTDLPVHLKILFTHTPTGFNWNQNNLAFVMNLILPFFLFAKKNWVKLFGAVTIYFIIYKTQSRGNTVAYFLILAIFMLFINKYKWLFRGVSVILIVISLIVGVNLSKIKSSTIGDAFNSIGIFLSGTVQEKNSIGLRQRYIMNGLHALKGTYGLGVGAGNSGLAKYHPDVSEGSSHISMHNFWIEILVDGGILFAFIFYIWYIYLIFSLFNVARGSPEASRLKYFSRASALSMAGFLVGAISASSVIYDLPMWILFGFSIAVINIYRNEKTAARIIKMNQTL